MEYGRYSHEERVYMKMVNCADTQTQVHMSTNENSDGVFVKSAEPQNPGELRASRVGRILICCDLGDSEPEG